MLSVVYIANRFLKIAVASAALAQGLNQSPYNYIKFILLWKSTLSEIGAKRVPKNAKNYHRS